MREIVATSSLSVAITASLPFAFNANDHTAYHAGQEDASHLTLTHMKYPTCTPACRQDVTRGKDEVSRVALGAEQELAAELAVALQVTGVSNSFERASSRAAV